MSRNFKLALTIFFTSMSLTACGGAKKESTLQPPPELGPKWGFIDHSGKFVIKPEFRRALSFSEGLAAADLSARWGYIDTTGKWVIDRQFEEVNAFHMGYAGVKTFGGKWQLIDKQGNAVTGATFEQIGECGQASKPLEPNTVIYCAVKTGPKWGFIDTKGAEKVPPTFDNVEAYSEGMAAVAKLGKWTFIDNTGKQICDFKFDKVEPFKDRVAEAYFGSDFVIIDDNGTMSMSDPLHSNSIFHDGLGLSLKKGKYGFINKAGKTVIKRRFTDAEDFSEGVAVVGVASARKGYIDTKGTFVIPPVFENALPFSDKMAAVKIDPRFIADDGSISASEVEAALKFDPHAEMKHATDAGTDTGTGTDTETGTGTATTTSTATTTGTAASTGTGTATGTGAATGTSTATSTGTGAEKPADKETKAETKADARADVKKDVAKDVAKDAVKEPAKATKDPKDVKDVKPATPASATSAAPAKDAAPAKAK